MPIYDYTVTLSLSNRDDGNNKLPSNEAEARAKFNVLIDFINHEYLRERGFTVNACELEDVEKDCYDEL